MPLVFAGFGTAAQSVSQGIFSQLSSVDWARPSWDLFIILFFVIAAVLYGLSLEKDKIMIILISIYMAVGVLDVAPFVGRLSGFSGQPSSDFMIPPQQVFVFKIVVFLGIFLTIFFLLSYSVNLKAIARAGLDKWWEVAVFSFLHVGLLISIILSFLPLEILSNFSLLTRAIFVDSLARFLWTVAPIAAMVLVKSKK